MTVGSAVNGNDRYIITKATVTRDWPVMGSLVGSRGSVASAISSGIDRGGVRSVICA